mgnify:FL=1
MIRDKVILTDCDGVLVDWEAKFTSWMIRNGYCVVDETAYNVAERFAKTQSAYSKDGYKLTKAVGQQLIKYFNESAAIETLSPLRDAIKYVRKLHEEHGYVFHVITSLSTDPDAARLRKRNLDLLFGPTVFEKIVCLDCGADKDDALEPYRDTGCFWVEDKIENAELGSALGLSSILLDHSYNVGYNGSIAKFGNWKNIYKYVTGEI